MTDDRVNAGSTPGSIATSLLDRVRRFETAAWHELVRLYSPLVYRWCRRAGLQQADAADVGQDVFRSVYAGLDGFRREQPGQSFRAWLRVVTRSRLCDWFRAREEAVEVGSQLDQLLSQADAIGADDERQIEMSLLMRRALEVVRGRVAEKTWLAFWRVTIEDRTVDETTQELDMTPNSVYLARSRILQQLRALLAELGEDENGGSGVVS